MGVSFVLVIGLIVTTVEQLFRVFAPMLEPFAPGLVDGLGVQPVAMGPLPLHLASYVRGATTNNSATSPSRSRSGPVSRSIAAWR